MRLAIAKEWFERQAALEGDLEVNNKTCFCIGLQIGQKLCPCALAAESSAAVRLIEMIPVTVIGTASKGARK